MPPRKLRQPDRSATESALQNAALALLERNGVLSGLNLREVAAEAGVNRGLVYHYFGSRRDLLRAALRSDVHKRVGDFKPGMHLQAPARYAGFLRTFLRHRRAVVLAALLTLDGDTVVRMVPDPQGARLRLARDVEERILDPDLDTEAAHVSLAALVYGYIVFRERFAAEIGTEADDLDERVARMTERMVGGLAPATAARP
ncbi:MAG TPA: TetR/AcrR family transcriptional regulator [Acidimicrobiales bacterium]|nr:TetR/AcrR family transcriptional regulator [Acidimicrobiales bacterium]